jgi:hypothetical protein
MRVVFYFYFTKRFSYFFWIARNPNMKRTAIVAKGAPASRSSVRDLYKRVLRLGNTWEARNPSQTPKEREYILDEARTLFHQHMHESDPQQVRNLVFHSPPASPL